MKTNRKYLLITSIIGIAFLVGCSAQIVSDTSKLASDTSAKIEKSSTVKQDKTDVISKSEETASPPSPIINLSSINLSSIPDYSGSPYETINGNEPYFSEDEYTTSSFDYYADLDELGRCGTAYACVGKDIMPTEERGSIGQIKPTGWHTIKYDCIDGKYLYNRCHLIGYQLTGENANEKNLITGTRYLNVNGMLPFENMVADYVKETSNHTLYRVTPVFNNDELVARGVLIEAKSVEDNGDGITFCVYCYNVQPDVSIDYATGDSEYTVKVTEESKKEESSNRSERSSQKDSDSDSRTYILNTNTKKFHLPNCSSVTKIKDSNKEEYTGFRDDVINRGYEPCKKCNP